MTQPTPGPKSEPAARSSPASLDAVLNDVANGKLAPQDAARALRAMQAQPLGFATLDHHRAKRCGSAEVVFAAGKTPQQTHDIAQALLDQHPCVLLTRTTPQQRDWLESLASQRDLAIEIGELSGSVLVGEAPTPKAQAVPIPVVTAGTSDLPVAEECLLTCKAMGQPTHAINDVGVAGLHRVIAVVDDIRAGCVVIVIAGMEGALPSVVGGLVDTPVIAVPTSVGYGASFAGVSALLGMLNSCASGVSVVNIDNGFGAAFSASRINRLACGDQD